MKYQKVLAFDPGQTTGVALGMVFKTSLLIYHRFNIKSLLEIAGLPWEGVQKVVYEGYHNSGASFDLSGVEVIGAVKLLAAQYEKPLIRVNPGSYHWAEKRLPHLINEKSHYDEAAGHLVFHLFEKGVRRFAIRNDCGRPGERHRALEWLETQPPSIGGEYNFATF